MDTIEEKVDHPLPTEKAALDWVDSALVQQKFVQEKNPSRENALAITNLEQAQMWAKRDLEIKLAGGLFDGTDSSSGDLEKIKERAEALDAQHQAETPLVNPGGGHPEVIENPVSGHTADTAPTDPPASN